MIATDERFDESIGNWLEQTAPARLPERVLEGTFERTRGSRQQVGRRALLGRMGVTRPVFALGGAVALVLVAALAFNVYTDRQAVGQPVPSDDPRSSFLGTWFSTDVDGGTQTMTIRATQNSSLEIVVTDDIATACSGAPSTMTGTGRLEGITRLVIPAPVYTCDDGSKPQTLNGPPLQEVPRNLTYVHDAQTGALYVGSGSVWTRVRGEVPSPEPTASPSPDTQPRSVFTERFHSPLHGLSIGYASGWQTRPATEPWTGGRLSFDGRDVDVIFDPVLQDDLYFALASEPLGGRSGDDWVSLDFHRSSGICPEGGSFGSWTVDGARGYIWDCSRHIAMVATATRGYIIHLHVGDDPILQATYNGDWFQAALETVDLLP